MTPENTRDQPDPDAGAPPRPTLPPAARRALAEAEARRRDAAVQAPAAEVGGRGGLDPGRFGDWEVKGLTSDF